MEKTQIAVYTGYMTFDLCIFLIFLEIFLATGLIVYIKIADDWALETTALIEQKGKEAVDSIKEVKAELIKLNELLGIIKRLKFSHFKNVATKIFDIVGIIVLLYPRGTKKIKLTGVAVLKLAKSLFSLFKPVFN